MVTSTLREQFDHQCRLAATIAGFRGIELDVVLVRHRNGDKSCISIIGNAINRAAYEIWRSDGSQVRTLRIYNCKGHQIYPKLKENHASL